MAPVFKTGEWHLAMSLVGSTPIRFRQLLSEIPQRLFDQRSGGRVGVSRLVEFH
jgi:hypothetical protein